MPKCKIVMKAGKRSGKKCGKECPAGQSKCSYHNRSKSSKKEKKDNYSDSESDNSSGSDSDSETWDIRDFIEMCKDFKYENSRDSQFKAFLNMTIKNAKNML